MVIAPHRLRLDVAVLGEVDQQIGGLGLIGGFKNDAAIILADRPDHDGNRASARACAASTRERSHHTRYVESSVGELKSDDVFCLEPIEPRVVLGTDRQFCDPKILWFLLEGLPRNALTMFVLRQS